MRPELAKRKMDEVLPRGNAADSVSVLRKCNWGMRRADARAGARRCRGYQRSRLRTRLSTAGLPALSGPGFWAAELASVETEVMTATRSTRKIVFIARKSFCPYKRFHPGRSSGCATPVQREENGVSGGHAQSRQHGVAGVGTGETRLGADAAVPQSLGVMPAFARAGAAECDAGGELRLE